MAEYIAGIQLSLGVIGLCFHIGIGFRMGWLLVDFINKKMGD